MNIKLDENYRIKSDSLQFMIVEEVNGREFIRGYYSTLEGALKGYLNLKMRKSEASSIFALMNYLKVLTTALNKALEPLKLEVRPLNQHENSKELNLRPKDLENGNKGNGRSSENL